MKTLIAFISLFAFSAVAAHAAAPESLPAEKKFMVTLKTDSVVLVGGVQKTFKAGESFTVFAGENFEVVSGEARLEAGYSSAVITAGNKVEVQVQRGDTGIKVLKGEATVTRTYPNTGRVVTSVKTEKDGTVFISDNNYYSEKVADTEAQGQTFTQSPTQEVTTSQAVVSPSAP